MSQELDPHPIEVTRHWTPNSTCILGVNVVRRRKILGVHLKTFIPLRNAMTVGTNWKYALNVNTVDCDRDSVKVGREYSCWSLQSFGWEGKTYENSDIHLGIKLGCREIKGILFVSPVIERTQGCVVLKSNLWNFVLWVYCHLECVCAWKEFGS